MRSDNELTRLEDDWAEDLTLVVSDQVARVFAHHLVEDLRARFSIRPKQAPRPRKKR